jgi:hypothetical protein
MESRALIQRPLTHSSLSVIETHVDWWQQEADLLDQQ